MALAHPRRTAVNWAGRVGGVRNRRRADAPRHCCKNVKGWRRAARQVSHRPVRRECRPWWDGIRRSLQSSRQQVEQASDQTADQRAGYADILQVTTDNELDSVGKAADIPLPYDLDKKLC